MATYTSVIPTLDTDHCKATHSYYRIAGTFDPDGVLTGNWTDSWVTEVPNKRLHVDLGSPVIIRRFRYDNGSTSIDFSQGVKDYTLWGSNSATAFNDLTFANDTDWTELSVDTNVLTQHIEADQADPHYVLVNNSVAYQYYAIKATTAFTGGTYFNLRRLEYQTEAVERKFFGLQGGLG